MKNKFLRFSQDYRAALRAYLIQESRANLQLALRLGRRAVVLRMETLGLARVHEQMLASLELPGAKKVREKQAEIFFTEAIIPIVETHRAARQSRADLRRLNGTLRRRTRELASTNRLLQQGVVRRKSVEAELKKSGDHYVKLLKDSLRLQETLRQLTRRVLAAQEDERKSISHELQDEVAQTLLGINVRLFSLKQEARRNTKGLKNQIASTQRLVVKSAKSVRQVARRLGGL